MVEIKINLNNCNGCGVCKDTCPAGVYDIIDEKSKPVNPNDCLVCRACEVQCPNEAIEVIE